MTRFLTLVFLAFMFLNPISSLAQCVPHESAVPNGRESDGGKPDDCTSVLAWAQAVQLNGRTEPSVVYINKLCLYAHLRNGQDVTLDCDDYTAERVNPASLPDGTIPLDRDGDGGLYVRNPWFDGDTHFAMPVEWDFSNGGIMILRPSNYPDNVFHWWNSYKPVAKLGEPQHWRVTVPDGTEYCYAEMQVYIQGPATVQLGMDYWTLPGALYEGAEVSNREGVVSPWFCKNEEWLTIRIGAPPAGSSTQAQVSPPPTAQVSVPVVAQTSGTIEAPIFDQAFKGPDGAMKQGKAVAFVMNGKTYFSKELVTQNKYGQARNPKVTTFYLLGGKKTEWHLRKGTGKALRPEGDFLVYDGVISGEHCQIGWIDPDDPAYDADSNCVWSAAAEIFYDRPGSFINNRKEEYGYLPVKLKG